MNTTKRRGAYERRFRKLIAALRADGLKWRQVRNACVATADMMDDMHAFGHRWEALYVITNIPVWILESKRESKGGQK